VCCPRCKVGGSLLHFSDRRQFSDIHISESSVATCSLCGAIFQTRDCGKFTTKTGGEKKFENPLTFGEEMGNCLAFCFLRAGFGMAVSSAGPSANNMHLAPDRSPHQHLITQFFCEPDALPDVQQTVSKH